jgi:hypothetical protein
LKFYLGTHQDYKLIDRFDNKEFIGRAKFVDNKSVR